MRFWQQAWAIAIRDLKVEGRSSEVLSVVLPFAAAAVFVVPLATDAQVTRLQALAFPVYWLVALLFGMQVALRQTGQESEMQRRHLALLGVDPSARFVGRSMAATLLISSVLALMTPLALIFYQPAPIDGWPLMIPVAALFASGLAMLATLAGDVTVGLRTRTALAPLLVVPVAVPLLMGAAQTLEALSRGDGTLAWILVLVITNLVLAAVGTLAARPLEEAGT